MSEEDRRSADQLDPDDQERKKRMEDVRKVCMRRRRAPADDGAAEAPQGGEVSRFP